MGSITIADVAKHAGVGVGTVSRVLNNTGSVSNAMRERVLNSVRELDYVPNPIAQQLKANRTMNIAYVTTSIGNKTFADITQGVNSVIAPKGYTLILMETNYCPEREMTLIDSLIRKHVDGIILVSSCYKDAPDVRDYIASLGKLKKKNVHIPVVQIAVPPLNLDVDSVNFDDEDCAYIAVSHLLELGRKDIACISVPKYSGTYLPRLNGYLRAMREAGLSDRIRVVEGDFTTPSGYRAMLKLLDEDKKMDAVFASCDHMAIGAIGACKDRGLRIPEDVAIIGIDDVEEALFVEPQLSSIRVPRVDMGKVAGELILNRLMNPSSKSYSQPQHILMATEIHVRGSTMKSAANKKRISE